MNSRPSRSHSGMDAIEATAADEQLLPFFSPISNIGVATIDKEFRYRAVNEALASANGYPVEAHIGRTIRQIIGAAADAVEPVFRQVFGTGESRIYEVAAKIPTRPTVGRWIMTCIPVKDAEDRVSRVCAIVIEITKKDALEDFLFNLTGKLLYLREGISKKPLHRLKAIQRSQWVGLLEKCTEEAIETLKSLRPFPAPRVTKTTGISDTPAAGELPEAISKFERLSRREKQVLQLLASSKNNKEVAVNLGISVRTAEGHRRRVMEKLGLHSVSEMIHLAIRLGIVEA